MHTQRTRGSKIGHGTPRWHVVVRDQSAAVHLGIGRDPMPGDKIPLHPYRNDSAAPGGLAGKMEVDHRDHVGDVLKSAAKRPGRMLAGEDVAKTDSNIPKSPLRIAGCDSNSVSTGGPELQ